MKKATILAISIFPIFAFIGASLQGGIVAGIISALVALAVSYYGMNWVNARAEQRQQLASTYGAKAQAIGEFPEGPHILHLTESRSAFDFVHITSPRNVWVGSQQLTRTRRHGKFTVEAYTTILVELTTEVPYFEMRAETMGSRARNAVLSDDMRLGNHLDDALNIKVGNEDVARTFLLQHTQQIENFPLGKGALGGTENWLAYEVQEGLWPAKDTQRIMEQLIALADAIDSTQKR